MNRLHLDKKDFWRFPLARALLKPLLKDGGQTLAYEKELKIWKLNGISLQTKNKKTYSKIAGFTLYVFHKIHMCFSATYRKKFNAAKLKIETARLQAKKSPPPQKTEEVLSNQHLAELFSALEDAIRSHDPIDKKGLTARIGAIIGEEQLEKNIERLRPEFRKLERQKSPEIPNGRRLVFACKSNE
jgi:hypothetical protein